MADELVYLGILGIKQVPKYKPLLVLNLIWRKEVVSQTLHNYIIVHSCFVSIFLVFLFKNLKTLSRKDMVCRSIKMGYSPEVLALKVFIEENE